MNVFACSPDPDLSAKVLDERRQNKLCLESAQLLANALHSVGKRQEWMCHPTHLRHPLTLWVAESRAHYLWLGEQMQALARRNAEFYRRPERLHVTVQRYLDNKYWRLAKYLPYTNGILRFQNCASNKELGLNFKWIEDTHEAYRNYLWARWQIELRAGVKFSPYHTAAFQEGRFPR